MNINYESYRIFYTVAKNNNITMAANELHISQPAVSKTIKNLEEHLGGQLFIRTKRGVLLTEEGKEFYKYIKTAMEYINNAENKFTELINLETGCIRIGISTTLTREFLLPYLKTFHTLYPNIDIQIITNISSELIKMLRYGLIDIIILNLSKNTYGEDIEIIKVKEIHDCFIANDNFKQLFNKEVSLKELNNYPLILLPKGANTRTFLDSFAEQNKVQLKPKIELASITLTVEFSKIGLGIGFVPREYITEKLKNKEVTIIKTKEKIPSRHIALALSKINLPNFCTKKLIELIQEKKT